MNQNPQYPQEPLEPHEYQGHHREPHDPHDPQGEEPRSLPLRGLAMVFIAIAVILALWGIYALMSDSTSSQNSTSASHSSAQSSAPSEQQKDHASDSAAPAPSEKPAEESSAENSEASNAPAPAPAPEGPVRVKVLNNSTVSGLAKTVSNSLKDRGFDVEGEGGNLQGEVMKASQTTVYFQQGNEAQERHARELAQQLGPDVAVAPFDDRLPAEARNPDSLTVVLVERPTL